MDETREKSKREDEVHLNGGRLEAKGYCGSVLHL